MISISRHYRYIKERELFFVKLDEMVLIAIDEWNQAAKKRLKIVFQKEKNFVKKILEESIFIFLLRKKTFER